MSLKIISLKGFAISDALVDGQYVTVHTGPGEHDFINVDMVDFRRFFTEQVNQRIDNLELSGNGPSIWPVARQFTMSGPITGSVSFDGSTNITIATQIADAALTPAKVSGLTGLFDTVTAQGERIDSLNTRLALTFTTGSAAGAASSVYAGDLDAIQGGKFLHVADGNRNLLSFGIAGGHAQLSVNGQGELQTRAQNNGVWGDWKDYWHAGTFDPTTKADVAGQDYTGTHRFADGATFLDALTLANASGLARATLSWGSEAIQLARHDSAGLSIGKTALRFNDQDVYHSGNLSLTALDYLARDASVYPSTSNLNVNDLVVGSKALVHSANLNTPSTADTYWFIETLKIDNSTRLIQRAYGTATGEVYNRTGDGTTFTAWARAWNSGNFNPDLKLDTTATAAQAYKLATGRAFALTGLIKANAVEFDGSGDVVLDTSLDAGALDLTHVDGLEAALAEKLVRGEAGVGGVASVTATFNGLTKSGFYRGPGSSEGSPSGSADDQHDVLHVHSGAGTGWQLASNKAGRLFTRVSATGDWATAAWEQMWTSADFDPSQFILNTRRVNAGHGLTGGGGLGSDVTVSLGTPGKISGDSVNQVTEHSHTHELSDELKAWDATHPDTFEAKSALKLANARSVRFIGAVTSAAQLFDGMQDLTFEMAIADGSLAQAKVTGLVSKLLDIDTRLNALAPRHNAEFTGVTVFRGDVVPDLDNVHSLGSPDKMWRDVYIGPGSLYLNGQKILEDTTSGTIRMTADANQNIAVQTSGTGDIELAPLGSGLIQLKGTVLFNGGSKIRSSNGLPLLFDEDLEFTAGTGLWGPITINGQTAWHAGNLNPASFLLKTDTAVAAQKLASARLISLEGVITGAVSFDGSTNATMTTAIADNALTIRKVNGLQGQLDSLIPRSMLGANGGVAQLGDDGKVLMSQLPSSLEDVLEVETFDDLPTTGVKNRLYVTLDTNLIYRWSGSTYIALSASPGSTDSVPEGTTNLYFTNDRASAAAPVQSVAGRKGNVTLTRGDVGLGSVNNTSDLAKPLSTAAINALANKLDATAAAASAQKLTTGRNFSISGPVSAAGVLFDGTADIELATTIEDGALSIPQTAGLSEALAGKLNVGATAAAASKLATPRNLSLSGVVVAIAKPFDGTAAVELETSIADGALTLAKTAGLEDALAGKLGTDGAAASALKLTTARNFSLTGVMTAAAVSFDGTGNVVLSTSIANGALSIAKTSGLQTALDNKLDIAGTAAAATKLATARTFSLTGPIAALAQSFDGSGNVVLETTIADGAFSIAKTAGLAAALAGKLDAAATAVAAQKLATARTVSLAGLVTATGVLFDGSGNLTLTTTIADGAITMAKVNGLSAALTAKLDAALLGANHGAAQLGADNLVLPKHLPAQFEYIVEVDTAADLPTTGVIRKLYVAKDTSAVYRWTGTAYLMVTKPVGTTDDVAEGATNLYFTTARAAAAAPVQSVAGKSGVVSLVKADVGLGNVDNTSDLNKPISSATQTALNAKLGSTATAVAATKLATARNFALSGVVAATAVSFDGTGNVTLTTTISDGALSIAKTSGLQIALDNKLDLTGTAAAAAKLAAARNFSLTGVITSGVQTFDGTGNLTLTTAVADGALSIAKTAGLASALNDKLSSSLLGAPDGIAQLGADGKLRNDQLPILDSAIVEVASYAALPATGVGGKLYITKSQGRIYRWESNGYVEVSGSANSTDELLEGSTNLYFTTARAAAAAPVKSVAGKTGAVSLVKADVGLGSVDNTSDINKPVSSATQTALDGKLNLNATAAAATKLQTARNVSLSGLVTSTVKAFDGTAALELETNIADGALSIAKTDGLTAALAGKLGATATAVAATKLATSRQISISGVLTASGMFDGSANLTLATTMADGALSLSKVSGLTTALDNKLETSLLGAALGVAQLGADGKILSTQLPGYVEDVVEVDSFADLPATGESGKLYVTRDNDRIYRWSGSTYVVISAAPGSSDEVIEGSTNLYFTTARAAAAAPVQSVAGRAGNVTLTKSDVGLSNADNTSDLAKPISTATQTALDNKLGATATATAATKLATARNFSLSGVMTAAAVAFDGTGNVVLATAIADSALSIAKTSGLQSALDGKLGATANAVSATKLATARSFNLTGVVTSNIVNFDGTGNITLTSAIADAALSIAKTSGLQSALDGKLGATATAVAATKLATSRTIALTGIMTGSAAFDGTANASITTSIADGALSIAKTSGLQAALDAKAAATDTVTALQNHEYQSAQLAALDATLRRPVTFYQATAPALVNRRNRYFSTSAFAASSYWGKSNLTFTVDGAIFLDGTLTEIVHNTPGQNSYLNQGWTSPTPLQIHTRTVIAKHISGTGRLILEAGGAAGTVPGTFDLINGTIVNAASSEYGYARIVPLGDGWYACMQVRTSIVSGQTQPFQAIYFGGYGNTPIATAIAVRGVQLEVGLPTAYQDVRTATDYDGSGVPVGSVWYDTSKGNQASRYNGATWDPTADQGVAAALSTLTAQDASHSARMDLLGLRSSVQESLDHGAFTFRQAAQPAITGVRRNQTRNSNDLSTIWNNTNSLTTIDGLYSLYGQKFNAVRVASTGADWHRRVQTVSNSGNLAAGTRVSVTLLYKAGTSNQLRLALRNFSQSNEVGIRGPVNGPLNSLSTSAGSLLNVRCFQVEGDIWCAQFTTELAQATSASGLELGIGPNSSTTNHDIVVLGAQVELGDPTPWQGIRNELDFDGSGLPVGSTWTDTAGVQRRYNGATWDVLFDPASKLDAGATAVAATKLATSRNFDITGIVTASAQSFDGTGNVTFSTAIADNALSIAKTSGLQSALDSKMNTSWSLTAGNGLTGGGSGAANRTITLGTPGTLSGSSTNAVQSASHTHELSPTLKEWDATPVSSVATSAALAALTTEVADKVSITATGLGRMGGGSDSTTNTPAAWSDLPAGYSRFMNASIGAVGGLPTANHYYFHKIARRDVLGGWAGIALGHNAGQHYIGRAVDNTGFANWERIWTSGNHGAGSGLNADLLDGEHGAYYLDAGNLTGALADARLSANVALKDGTNTFTGTNTFNNAVTFGGGLTSGGDINLTGDRTINFNAGGLRSNNSQSAMVLWVNEGSVYLRPKNSTSATGQFIVTEGSATHRGHQVWTAEHFNHTTFAAKAITATAGNGLTGGGTLGANFAFALGTPSTLSGSSTNAVTATSHSHELSANLKLWDAQVPSSYALASNTATTNTDQLITGVKSHRANLWGSLSSNRYPLLGGFVMDIHQESNTGMTIPFLMNDLAYLLSRGGSVTTNHPSYPNGHASFFNGAADYVGLNPNCPEVLTVEVTPHKTFTWGSNIGISFGHPSFAPRNIVLEVWDVGATDWKLVDTVTGNAEATYQRAYNNSGTGWNKFRFTLSDWRTTQQRIAQIWALAYNSQIHKEVLVGRDGGDLYGTLKFNSLTASTVMQLDAYKNVASVAMLSAFNKNFGTGNDEVMRGDYAPSKAGVGATGTWGIGISGNAATATRWATARTLTAAGIVTGSVSIDGSANVTLTTAIADNALTIAKTSGLQAALDAKMATSWTLTAGNGLSGGGNGTANRSIALGTPSTISGTSTNNVSSTSHSHELDMQFNGLSTAASTEYPNNQLSIGNLTDLAYNHLTARSNSDNRVMQFLASTTGGNANPTLRFRTSHAASGSGWSNIVDLVHSGNIGDYTGDFFNGNTATIIVEEKFNGSNVSQTHYKLLGTVGTNAGHLAVRGVLAGHEISQSRAQVDLSFFLRGSFCVQGTITGRVGTGAWLEVYENANGSYSLYACRGPFYNANFEVRATGPGGSSLSPNAQWVTTAPEGTLRWNMRDNNPGDTGSVTLAGPVTQPTVAYLGSTAHQVLTTSNVNLIPANGLTIAQVSGLQAALDSGNNAASVANDFNAINKSGFYYTTSETPVGTPVALSSLSVTHIEQVSGNATQICQRVGLDQIWTRRRLSGNWSPWVELFHSGNFNPATKADASTNFVAGNGLTGGGTLAAGRTFTLGTPGAVTLSSTNAVQTAGHTHAFTPGGSVDQYIDGSGALQHARLINKLTATTSASNGTGTNLWTKVLTADVTAAYSGYRAILSLMDEHDWNESVMIHVLLRTAGTLAAGPQMTIRQVGLSTIDSSRIKAIYSQDGAKGTFELWVRRSANVSQTRLGVVRLNEHLEGATTMSFPSGAMQWQAADPSGTFNAFMTMPDLNSQGLAWTGRQLIAGNGLVGGGDLSADRTFTLGTPSAITGTSTNSVTAGSHTHAFDQTHQAVSTDGIGSYPINQVSIGNVSDLNVTHMTARSHSDYRVMQFLASAHGTGGNPTLRFRSFHNDSGWSNTLDVVTSAQTDATATNNSIAQRSTTGQLMATDFRTASGDGRGVRFWDSDTYKIFMSQVSSTTFGGRIAGDTTSDYNMYFRMGGGLNRGFVFENSYAQKIFSIHTQAIRSAVPIIAPSFEGSVSVGNLSGKLDYAHFSGDVIGDHAGVITNPMFDTDLSGWSTSGTASGSTHAYDATTTSGASGGSLKFTDSLRVSNDGSFPVRKGEIWIVRFDVKTNAAVTGSPEARIGFTKNPNSASWVGGANQGGFISGPEVEWVAREYRFTVTEDATAWLRFGVSSLSGGSSTEAWIDNVRCFRLVSFAETGAQLTDKISRNGDTMNGNLSFLNDDRGVDFYQGARIYKRAGGGLTLRRHAGEADPAVENYAGTTRWTIMHGGNADSVLGTNAIGMSKINGLTAALAGKINTGGALSDAFASNTELANTNAGFDLDELTPGRKILIAVAGNANTPPAQGSTFYYVECYKTHYSSSDTRAQMAYSYTGDSSQVWYRHKGHTGVWTSWVRFADHAALDTKVNKAGDTMTGALTVPAFTLNPTNGDGVEAMRINMERAWVIEQLGTAGSTHMQFRALTADNKSTYFSNMAQTSKIRLNPDVGIDFNGNQYWHAGTFNPASKLDATAAAVSANTLTTARTINGTSFNGSANITTANWGTARNFTLGGTTKSVNGSANMAWNANEIMGNQQVAMAQGAIGFNGQSSNITPPSPASSNAGITAGNGDGSSATVNNLRLWSWFGIGFSPSIANQSVPQWEYSHFFNTRNGNMNWRGIATGNGSGITNVAAEKLATARLINGVAFDGTADITITATADIADGSLTIAKTSGLQAALDGKMSTDWTLTAGNGLSGGGTGAANRTITLGTPGTTTGTTTNAVQSTSHTHELNQSYTAASYAVAATSYPDNSTSIGNLQDGSDTRVHVTSRSSESRVLQLLSTTGGGSTNRPRLWFRTSHAASGGWSSLLEVLSHNDLDAYKVNEGWQGVRDLQTVGATPAFRQATAPTLTNARRNSVDFPTSGRGRNNGWYSNSNIVYSADAAQVGPDGKLGVLKAVLNASASMIRIGATSGGTPYQAYTGSLWIRTADGATRTGHIDINDAAPTKPITVTPSWERFYHTGISAAAFRFADFNLPAGEYHIFGAQVEAGSQLTMYQDVRSNTDFDGSNLPTNSLWFDTANGNRPQMYDAVASVWVDVSDNNKMGTGWTLTAGNGLTGGGNGTANRTVTLGTPSTIGAGTTNSVTSTSHSHELSNTVFHNQLIALGNDGVPLPGFWTDGSAAGSIKTTQNGDGSTGFPTAMGATWSFRMVANETASTYGRTFDLHKPHSGSNDDLYVRGYNSNGTVRAWRKLWHAGDFDPSTFALQSSLASYATQTDLTNGLAGQVSKAGDTMTGELVLAPSTAATAMLNIPHGAAVTTLANGDIWTTTGGLFARINGATQTIAHTGTWSQVSQAEAEAGTLTTNRLWTAQRVRQAIAAYGPAKDGTGATGTWGIGITGNAATATKLATARTINGVAFDGTANITISAAATVDRAANYAWTGTHTFNGFAPYHTGNLDLTPYVTKSQSAAAYIDPNTLRGTLSHAVVGGTALGAPAPWMTAWNLGTNGSRDGQFSWNYSNGDSRYHTRLFFRAAHDAGNNWKAWQELWKATPDIIPAEANLNTYDLPGDYHQPSNANAATGTNYPITNAGMLSVHMADSGNYVYQRYRHYATSQEWTRTRYANAWTSWQKVVARAELDYNARTTSDWNTAVGNGWWMAFEATNAPAGGWLMCQVTVHNDDWVQQEAFEFTAGGPIKRWRRQKNAGGWLAWTDVQVFGRIDIERSVIANASSFKDVGVNSAFFARGAKYSQFGGLALLWDDTRIWQIGAESNGDFKLWAYNETGAYNGNPMTIKGDGRVGLNTEAGADHYSALRVGGGIRSIGGAALVGFTARDDARQFDWYATGNRARLYADGIGDLFSVGTGKEMNVTETHYNGGSANPLRMVYGAYGAFFRQDGGDLYLMVTDANNPYGGWNGLRPMRWNLATGNVFTDHNFTAGGTFTAGRIATGWDSGVGGSVSCSNWFRSSGDTGWYSNTYGGGIHCTDTTYVRAYNGKAMAASNFVISSDKRLKSDIRPFEYRGRLEPVMFTMTETREADFGFIADRVAEQYPEACGWIEQQTGPLKGQMVRQLSYMKLTAVISYQVNRLEDKFIATYKEVKQLRAEVTQLIEERDAVAKRQQQLEEELMWLQYER